MRTSKTIRSGSILIAAYLSIAAAGAQTSGSSSAPDESTATHSSGEIPEIIVTAQKREQSLQKVPVSVDVVSGNTLAERQVQSAAQLSAVVPSFEFVRAPNLIPGLTFRGIGPQAGNISFDSSIGMLVDGVFFGNVRLFNQTLFDTDRAELIKGTQGALLGRNTTIGALSIVNKRPGNDFGGHAEVGGEAQNGGYFGDFAVDLPASDAWKFRISGRYSFDKGWLKNTTTGLQGPVDTDDGIRAQALYKFSDKGDLLLSYTHTDNQVVGSSSQISELGLAAIDQGAGPSIGGVTYGTNYRASYSSDPRLRNGDDLNIITNDIASATLNYDLGPATLTSVTAGAWTKTSIAIDFDFDNKDDTVAIRDERYKQASQEIRLASNDAVAPIQYLAGFYYFHSALNVVADYDYGIPDFPPPFLGLGLPPGSLLNGAFRDRFDQSVNSYAGFGQVTWKATDKLSANLGLRYSWEKKNVSIGQSMLPGPITLFNTIINAPFPYQTLIPVVDKLLSGSASTQYQFTDDVMAYAAYGRGGKSGGYGELNTFSFDGKTFANGVPAGNPQRDAYIGPERSNTYEIGLKSRFLDRRLTIDSALFWMDIFGLQELVFTPAGDFVSSSDRVRSKGAETTIEFRPISDIAVGLSGTYADVWNLETHQRPAQSPRLSATSHLDWNHDILAGYNLAIGAAVRYRSGKFNQLGEAQYDGAFTTLGLHARLESRYGWFLNVAAENVTDARGADFGYPGPDPFVGAFKSLAPLRTVWISIGTKF